MLKIKLTYPIHRKENIHYTVQELLTQFIIYRSQAHKHQKEYTLHSIYKIYCLYMLYTKKKRKWLEVFLAS